MTIDDFILLVLLTWIVPLSAFVFYFVTDPVPGARWRRGLIDLRSLKPMSRILLGQKVAFILVVLFIASVRFFGDYVGREWIALALYASLVWFAWLAFFDLRNLQRPREEKMRGTEGRFLNR